jgi:periplasmic copper chaperone A
MPRQPVLRFDLKGAMIRRVFLAFPLLCLTATPPLASDIMVMDAYARASLTPSATSGAAYMTLMNHGVAADTLVKVTTDAANAEIHETQTIDGVMKMRPVERLVLQPNATVALVPGGLHLMLTGLKAPLKDGGTIKLTLTFEKSGAITVDIPVRKLSALPQAGHEHGDSQ